jgi:hypothetical protein
MKGIETNEEKSWRCMLWEDTLLFLYSFLFSLLGTPMLILLRAETSQHEMAIAFE